MPGAIFVSYRRATTSNAAGRLADRLMDRFGEEQVFVDVDAIEPGVDWVDMIEKAVAVCRVLLVVIGPTWHSVTDESGGRRLDDPYDPVVIEVRAGLANPGVRVIPVLVEGAKMPHVRDLPPDLAQLARLNAGRLEHATFRQDAARLVGVLERVLADLRRHRRRSRRRWSRYPTSIRSRRGRRSSTRPAALRNSGPVAPTPPIASRRHSGG